ncbi:hypothetical protein LTS18_014966 [Coniosporium uncinatum]|uniref:Uncharacterized protein n=1 Tax=Coniosporium uncinatum TaxID=93489 RepID=A0ACC3DGF0_9PEZI|nr:hypothetical protein LTS18_014966 [Coniosporium uncinatum]
MADATEKSEKEYPQTSSSEEAGTVSRPKGWMYKSVKIGPWQLPWIASPAMQLLLVSLVCFLCPGMFNALNGMGGGGQVDPKASNDANTAVYATFAFVGFFAGTITNRLGIRTALAIGGIGYAVYVSSYLCYNYTQNRGYMIFSGVLLGTCAGILWTAQGAIMMSYPPEHSKGKYIGWFWMIFNLGAVIGGLIPLGQNINVTTDSRVTTGTYVGFLVLTLLGAALALTAVNPKSVVRSDGSKVILMKNPTWKSELMGMYEVFRTDTYIVLLFPMFFASNWFYTYHFNGVNLGYFDTRTRALNNVLYYLMQIVAAYVFGYALDIQSIRRTRRAAGAWIVLFVLTMIIWGGGYEFQKGYTRAQTSAGSDTPDDPSDDYVKKDFNDSGYVGPMFLYMFYGFYDAAWQTCVYW